MAAEALQLPRHRPKLSDNPVWQSSRITPACRMGRLLAARYDPAVFTFLAGVSLPFSIGEPNRKDQPFGVILRQRLCGHLSLSFWDLPAIGWSEANELTFEIRSPKSDRLYVLFFARVRLARGQWISLGAILVGYGWPSRSILCWRELWTGSGRGLRRIGRIT